jgi:hypothetical protein
MLGTLYDIKVSHWRQAKPILQQRSNPEDSFGIGMRWSIP